MSLFRKRPSMEYSQYEDESLIEDIYGRQRDKEISEIEQNAERVEAYERMRSRKRRKGFLRVASVLLLMFVLTAAVVYTGYRFLFVIRTVEVVGNCPYSSEEVAAGAGIEIGDTLYSFSSVKAEERLVAALPCIKSITVERNIPDTIVINVNMEDPMFYTEIYGKNYLLSDSLRVVGEAKNESTEELVWLRVSGVKNVVFGSIPTLRDSIGDEHLVQVTDCIKNSSLNGRIVQIDIRDPYKLVLVCDDKYLLEMGDYSEIDTKLRLAASVLEDDMFKTKNKARIDLSDLSETIVVVDNQLDFTK